MAINVAQRKSLPLSNSELDRQPRETQYGYIDGVALMNNVVDYGDAPEGDFRAFWSTPL